MISDEEFKELTNALEGVGHYDPSIGDLINHFKESPSKWIGFRVDNRWEDDFTVLVTGVKEYNLSEGGRFKKTIDEFFSDPLKHKDLIEKEHGLILYHFSNSSEEIPEIVIYKPKK